MEVIENKLLPQALMIGVDYELFWTLTPKTIAPFIKAFELKTQHEETVLWKLGVYVRLAVGSCLSDKMKYPNEPLGSIDTDKQASIKRKFMQRMEIINSNF